jgi:hypothetical protein
MGIADAKQAGGLISGKPQPPRISVRGCMAIEAQLQAILLKDSGRYSVPYEPIRSSRLKAAFQSHSLHAIRMVARGSSRSR